MMTVKGLARYTAALMLCMLAICCTKDAVQDGAPIVFCVEDGVDVSQTKSAITGENLSSSDVTVKVYATKDSQGLTNLAPGVIEPKRVFWGPSAGDVNWVAGSSYTFQGYAYTPSNTTRFPSISNEGLSFTVQQPTNYNTPSDMADYVISNKVEVSNEESGTHPLVVLEFEHVLPSVSVYVTYSPSLGERTVKVTEMKLATLLCRAKMDFQDGRWIPSYPSISNGTFTVKNLSVGHDREHTEAKMDIITVPQQLTSTAVLTVKYSVDEGGASPKAHTQTFNLSEYGELKGGHRTVFHVNIDTSVHLEASIAEWKHIDFIEGTVLPPIAD